MTSEPGLSASRLARRSLAHRRGQTALIVVLGTLISAVAVFTAGYQRQVQQALVDTTFTPNGAGNAWQLAGPEETSPVAVLPAETDRFFEPPVAGRVVPVLWVTPTVPGGISGTLLWRADSCAHLIMASGRCPTAVDEVAVSTADAERYDLSAGQRVSRLSPISQPQDITVTGVYQPRDPTRATGSAIHRSAPRASTRRTGRGRTR